MNLKIIIINFLLIFLLIFLLGCNNVYKNKIVIQNNQTNLKYDKIIVAFGDSLTEGFGINKSDAYPSQLEKELNKLKFNIKVYNSGFSGETTFGALSRINWVLKLKPDIVILGIGANDAIRGIDLNITETNILKIIKKLKKKNITIILSGQIIFENLGKKYVNKFENMYPKIAKSENLSFIPIFLKNVVANSTLNNKDEIHPNKYGYEIIVKKNILPILLPIIK